MRGYSYLFIALVSSVYLGILLEQITHMNVEWFFTKFISLLLTIIFSIIKAVVEFKSNGEPF